MRMDLSDPALWTSVLVVAVHFVTVAGVWLCRRRRIGRTAAALDVALTLLYVTHDYFISQAHTVIAQHCSSSFCVLVSGYGALNMLKSSKSEHVAVKSKLLI
ncbi:microtubule-actin cross-linking factor 1 isoform X17 [Tachysurus ichikawai]